MSGKNLSENVSVISIHTFYSNFKIDSTDAFIMLVCTFGEVTMAKVEIFLQQRQLFVAFFRKST